MNQISAFVFGNDNDELELQKKTAKMLGKYFHNMGNDRIVII